MNNGNLGKVDTGRLMTLGGKPEPQQQPQQRRHRRGRDQLRDPTPQHPLEIDVNSLRRMSENSSLQFFEPPPQENPETGLEIVEPTPLPEPQAEAAPVPAAVPEPPTAPPQPPAAPEKPKRVRQPRTTAKAAVPPALPSASVPDQPLSWSARCHRYPY